MVHMAVMGSEKQKLKMSLDPQTFLGRLECDNHLKGLINGSTAIVSVKDIAVMERNEGGKLNVEELNDGTFMRILRAAKTKKGVNVYGHAAIEQTKVPIQYAFVQQTFADVSKLAGLTALGSLLRASTGFGVHSAPALTLHYESGNGIYVAFYIPPIIELVPKQEFGRVLENVRTRILNNDELKFNPADGIPPISLRTLFERSKFNIDSSKVDVPVIVDGTHRVLAFGITGAQKETYSSVVIKDSERTASSLPIRLGDVLFTLTKPSREDRFLGLNEEGWIQFKEVGIDN